MKNEQSSTKEIWEKVKYLFGVVFFGFLYGIGFLAFFGMLLQWTLGIDISESDNIYRLLFIFWGVCTLGWHLRLKDQEKKREVDSKPMSNLEKSEPDKNYMEYKKRFEVMTDGQLKDVLNREVGNNGWTSSRASYLVALREEFEKRKIILIDKKK